MSACHVMLHSFIKWHTVQPKYGDVPSYCSWAPLEKLLDSILFHHVKAWMTAPCSFQLPMPLPPPQDGILHHATHVYLVSLSKWFESGGLPLQAQKICLFIKLLKWNTKVMRVSLLSVLSTICLRNVFQALQSSSLISWCNYNLKAHELKHLCITL
jgi:hypothetical protein